MSVQSKDDVEVASSPRTVTDSASVESWFDGLSLADAFRSLEQGLRVISRRLSAPDARDEFAPYTPASAEGSPAHPERPPRRTDSAGGSLPELLRAGETLTRLVSGVQQRLDGFTAEVFHQPQERAVLLGLPAKGKVGFRNPGEFLQDTTNISRHAAQQRARQAEHFRPHAPASTESDQDQQTTGSATGRLGRLLPSISRGLQELWLGADRLAVITRAIDKIRAAAQHHHVPTSVVDEHIAASDTFLVEAARHASFAEFSAEVSRWRNSVLMNLNPQDDATADERDAYQDRALTFLRRDGELFLWQVATTQDGHEMLTLVDAAANSPRARGAKSCSDSTDETEPDAPAVADDRSRPQRAHDGFMGTLTSGLRGLDNGLPDQGGARPQLIVNTGLIPMLRMAHHAGLLPESFDPALLTTGSSQELLISAGYSGTSGAAMLRRMLCHADILPVVLGAEGEVLDSTKAHRLFSTAQRKALVARDGGCAVPGCTFPAAWCEAHHITAWKNGGPTTIDNGVLLCTHHHHAVHEGHWQITVDRGVPWFAPTTKLRPYLAQAELRPARNTYWRDHRRRFLPDGADSSNHIDSTRHGRRSRALPSATSSTSPPSTSSTPPAPLTSPPLPRTGGSCPLRHREIRIVHRLRIPAPAGADDAEP